MEGGGGLEQKGNFDAQRQPPHLPISGPVTGFEQRLNLDQFGGQPHHAFDETRFIGQALQELSHQGGFPRRRQPRPRRPHRLGRTLRLSTHRRGGIWRGGIGRGGIRRGDIWRGDIWRGIVRRHSVQSGQAETQGRRHQDSAPGRIEPHRDGGLIQEGQGHFPGGWGPFGRGGVMKRLQLGKIFQHTQF